jgi:hypothetical protein
MGIHVAKLEDFKEIVSRCIKREIVNKSVSLSVAQALSGPAFVPLPFQVPDGPFLLVILLSSSSCFSLSSSLASSITVVRCFIVLVAIAVVIVNVVLFLHCAFGAIFSLLFLSFHSVLFLLS